MTPRSITLHKSPRERYTARQCDNGRWQIGLILYAGAPADGSRPMPCGAIRFESFAPDGLFASLEYARKVIRKVAK
jgi:hypothetical protein